MGELNSLIQVLVIAHSFPPCPEVGGRRIASFCRYLPEFGIRPIVLTVDERCLPRRDDSFPMPKGIIVERTTELQLYSWYGGLKKRLVLRRNTGNSRPPPANTTTRPDSGRSFIVRQLAYLSDMPDPHLGWYPPAVRAAGRLIRRETIDAIFSSGPPWTTHLVARRLRERHGVPWIADFRDPWADARHRREAPHWAAWLHSKMESSCLRWADLVMCNTEPLRRNFVGRYGGLSASKFITLTNGFGDDVPPPREEPRPTKRILLHLGSLYGARRIDTFCQAIRSLLDAGQIEASSLRILFIGEVDLTPKAAAVQLLTDLVESKSVEFVPPVDWRTGQRLLWGADLLLLFQGGFHIQVPAKFYEYLRTGKPIFAVASQGALTDLLESTGSGLWADPQDPAGIAAGLLRALQLPAVPPEEAERRWSSQFHFRSLTAELAGRIRQLASQRSLGAGA